MNTDMTTSLTSALSGLQVGVNKARSAAGEVAKLTTGSDSVRDAIAPLLKLQDADTQVAVTANVVQVENDTLGRFIDETA
ncbi:MAG: hypothetical protein KAT06_01945 [Gammaproteobacteria bacterium]|nr:hypothetical protein [Gammaproteobacteria bacterium]